MRVMVLVKATEDSEAGRLPSTELLTAMGRFNQELAEAGILLRRRGPASLLEGQARGLRRGRAERHRRPLRRRPANSSPASGSGRSRTWRRRSPGRSAAQPDAGPSEIEIRPLFEMADFGAALTPEIAAAEARLRDQVAGG